MQKSIMFFHQDVAGISFLGKPASHRANPACASTLETLPTSVQQVLTELNILSYLLRSFLHREPSILSVRQYPRKTQKALAELLPSAPLLSMARV